MKKIAFWSICSIIFITNTIYSFVPPIPTYKDLIKQKMSPQYPSMPKNIKSIECMQKEIEEQYAKRPSYSLAYDDAMAYVRTRTTEFKNALAPYFAQENLDEINDNIKEALTNCSAVRTMTLEGTFYNPKLLEQLIYTGILRFIYDACYCLAYEELQNEEAAKEIAFSIHNDAYGRIQRNKVLKTTDVVKDVTKILKHKIALYQEEND